MNLDKLLLAVKGNGLRAQLVRGGIGSVVVKAAGMGLSLAAALILARLLGPEGYGVYSYVFALIGVVTIPAQFGLPQLVMRETAKAQANADWAGLKGIWRWAGVTAGGLSLLLVALGGLGAWLLADQFTSAQLVTFAWGLLLVPVLVLGRLRGAALRGLQHVVAGQFPEMVLRPGLLVAFVLGIPALGLGGVLTSSRATFLHVLAAGLAFVVGAVLLRQVRPREARSAEPRFNHRAWAGAMLPLGLTAGMQLITRQADILMLGLFVDAAEVGIYRVAIQGATLVAFGLQVVNMVVTPQVTRLHNQGNHRQLQRLATVSARVALGIAVPCTLAYTLFGDWILRVVVGGEYVKGATPLAILALGQLVNAGMGSVGQLLNMTDHEVVVTRTLTMAAMLNIGANLVLIPLWGMNGAAASTAITFVIWNSLLARAVSNRLSINSTALGT